MAMDEGEGWGCGEIGEGGGAGGAFGGEGGREGRGGDGREAAKGRAGFEGAGGFAAIEVRLEEVVKVVVGLGVAGAEGESAGMVRGTGRSLDGGGALGSGAAGGGGEDSPERTHGHSIVRRISVTGRVACVFKELGVEKTCD